MSREIKFRGLIESQNEGMANTPTDEWVYGSLILEPNRSIIQWIENNVVHAEIVVTDSVGQYTGLKDKNGVEIYKGDIVQWIGFKGEEDYTRVPCVCGSLSQNAPAYPLTSKGNSCGSIVTMSPS